MSEPTEVQSEMAKEEALARAINVQNKRPHVHVELRHPINWGKSKRSKVVYDVADENGVSVSDIALKILHRNQFDQIVLTQIPMANVVLWDIVYLDSELVSDIFAQ